MMMTIVLRSLLALVAGIDFFRRIHSARFHLCVDHVLSGLEQFPQYALAVNIFWMILAFPLNSAAAQLSSLEFSSFDVI